MCWRPGCLSRLLNHVVHPAPLLNWPQSIWKRSSQKHIKEQLRHLNSSTPGRTPMCPCKKAASSWKVLEIHLGPKLKENRCYLSVFQIETLGMYFSQLCLFGQRVQSPLWLFSLQPLTAGPRGRVVNTTLWLDGSRECPGWPGKMVLLWWHCRRGQRASLSR